jgi:aminobutyraldehyde dehydrogenase
MTVLNRVPALTVRRTDGASPLISENDLPPGGHFIDGEFRPSSSGRTATWWTRAARRRSRRSRRAPSPTSIWRSTAEPNINGVATPEERSLILLQIADRWISTATCW